MHDYSGLSAGRESFQALVHAVDEFFEAWALPDFREPGGRKYADLPTDPYSYDNRAQFGDSHPHHILAFIPSLCSEADTFIRALAL